MKTRTSKVYEIYTEDKGIPKLREEIEHIINVYFDGYTIFDDAIGYWHSARENSLMIKIITDRPDLISRVAKGIKIVNKQEAVLVVAYNADVKLI